MTYPRNRAWDGYHPPLEDVIWSSDAPNINTNHELMEGINGYGDQASVLFPRPGIAGGGLLITSTRGEEPAEQSNRLQLQLRIRGNSVNAVQRGSLLRIDAPQTATLGEIKTAVDNLSTDYTTAYVDAASASTIPGAFSPINFSGGTPDRAIMCEVVSEGPILVSRGTARPSDDTQALMSVRGGGLRFTLAPGESVYVRSATSGQQHYSCRGWLFDR